MKTFTIEISDLEYKALLDSLVDPTAWVTNMVISKVEACVNRALGKEQSRLLADPSIQTIPANVDSILESHFSQPNYKTRREREIILESTEFSDIDNALSRSADE